MVAFFSPVLFSSEAVAARSFTFIGYARSATSSVDLSSLSAGAIASGDLCIYVDYAGAGSVPTAVTPSGFTNRIDTSLTYRGMVSDKKLAGSETTVTGMDGTDDNKVALVFRPSSAFTTTTASTPTSQMTNANPSSQSIAPAAETGAVIVIGVSATPGTAAFSTASPAFDATIATSDADLLVGYKIYAAGSAANHSIDMSDLVNNNWLAGLYYTVS